MFEGGCSLILKIDAISKVGGVTITRNKQVKFLAAAPTMQIGKVSAVSVGVGVDKFDRTLTSNSTGELLLVTLALMLYLMVKKDSEVEMGEWLADITELMWSVRCKRQIQRELP